MWRSQDQGACQHDVAHLGSRSPPDRMQRVPRASIAHARPATTRTGPLPRAGYPGSPGSQEQMACAPQPADLKSEMNHHRAGERMLACRGVCQCPQQGVHKGLRIRIPQVASALPSVLAALLPVPVRSTAEPANRTTAGPAGQPPPPHRAT